jgi:hypothetical protein
MKLLFLGLILLIVLITTKNIYNNIESFNISRTKHLKGEKYLGTSQLKFDEAPFSYNEKQKIIDENAIKTKPIKSTEGDVESDKNDSTDYDKNFERIGYYNPLYKVSPYAININKTNIKSKQMFKNVSFVCAKNKWNIYDNETNISSGWSNKPHISKKCIGFYNEKVENKPDKWGILLSCENDDCTESNYKPFDSKLEKSKVKGGETVWGFSEENPEGKKSSHQNISMVWKQKKELNGKKLDSSNINETDFFQEVKGKWEGQLALGGPKDLNDKQIANVCLNEKLENMECLGYVITQEDEDNKKYEMIIYSKNFGNFEIRDSEKKKIFLLKNNELLKNKIKKL